MKKIQTETNIEKMFIDIFKKLCSDRNEWQVWTDLMIVSACAISNSVDRSQAEDREKEYLKSIQNLKDFESATTLFSLIVQALEENPEQDFLGNIYTKLELHNHWKGQFFTPYYVARCMAVMTIGEGVKELIDTRGFITINDPACGGGSLLIASANTMRKLNINFQTSALFIAQDIDKIVALMCYIQLSLLGCAGYVVVGDVFKTPLSGNIFTPNITEVQEVWYMPMFNTPVWEMRRELQKKRLQ